MPFDISDHKFETVRLTVQQSENGYRADRFLASRLNQYSRAQIQKLIKSNCVLIDGSPIRQSQKLESDSVIELQLHEQNAAQLEPLEPQDLNLKILHSDSDIAIIDKRPSLAIHPGAGRDDGTLVNGLLHLFPEIRDVGGSKRPGIVHRLDMDTSGVLVIARTQRAYLHMISQFEKRRVEKTYLALVHGIPKHPKATIEAPIGRSKRDRRRMAIDGVGQAAITRYKTLYSGKNSTLLQLSLITGRTHQARVHLSAVDLPIMGDRDYGGNNSRNDNPLRQMLHAWKLGFELPTGKTVSCIAGIPEDFVAACTQSGIMHNNLEPYLKDEVIL
tara:strand:+ start:1183 stop:2172 length:990 start_codon:yes stop_codon:yes gene_type:complete